MSVREINDITFYSGKGAQERMFKMAKQDTFFVATDFAYKSDDEIMISKAYKSFKDIDAFCDIYYPRHKDHWNLYELIRENTKCKLYFDFDFNTKQHDESDLVSEINTFIKDNLSQKYTGITMSKWYLTILSGSHAEHGSLHVIVNGSICDSNASIKETILGFSMSSVIKDTLDMSVYTKNRLFRLPYSSKMKSDGSNGYPFIPMTAATISECVVTI